MSKIMDRRQSLGLFSNPGFHFTSGQLEQDQLLQNFSHEASDWKSLAAMMAGGLSYRLGNIAYLKSLPGNLSFLSKLSPAAGLLTEVTTFRSVNKLLHTGATSSPPINIFSGKEFFTDIINFGTLKVFGKLGGNNLILNHFTQDSAMVLGHQIAYGLNLATAPQGSLLQQYVHAESTNIALAAGTALAHSLSGGKLLTYEKNLEAIVEATQARQNASASFKSFRQKKPEISFSSQNTDTPYGNLLQTRLGKMGDSQIHETENKLSHEWERWPKKTRREASTLSKLNLLLPHYARFAQAHLGKETPPYLPFIQEVYEMAVATVNQKHSELVFGTTERSTWIQFLTSQEGRRSFGETVDASSPTETLTRKTFEAGKVFMGKSYSSWENHLQESTDALQKNTFQKAQIYQRALAFMHFYVSALESEKGSGLAFEKIPFNPKIAEKILATSSKHPYPEESIGIFLTFFRKMPEQGKITLQIQIPHSEKHEELEALPTSALSFLDPRDGETWAEYLTRSGLTRAQLRSADLGVAGTTIYSWGSSFDSAERIAPPGDIVDLLGVVTYLNTTHENAVDPFEAIRRTLPTQLTHFAPDPQNNVVIYYPKSMRGLDYAHFGLGAFLRAHLRSIPEGHDIDLARQWEVSESTVSDFRRGVVRKMRLETLEKMAKNFTQDESQCVEMFKFLMFLRYRAYFDASLAVTDQDGSALNHKSPYSSRIKIILRPHEEDLRAPDSTQRIRFEREPFASVLDGSADYALRLLEQKSREFDITAQETITVGNEAFGRTELRARLANFRNRHTTYFEILNAHEKSPGVVRPGELREMQEFYRDFFKFFELIYLHAYPEAQFKVAETVIRFRISPSTHEHVRGITFREDSTESTIVEAKVVASDMLELGKAIHDADLIELIKLRIAIRYLHEQGLFLMTPEAEKENRVTLQTYLADQNIVGERANHLLQEYYRLEAACSSWSGHIIDPSENAILHKITKGFLSQTGAERRKNNWQSELTQYIQKHGLFPIQDALQWIFTQYLQRVQQPYRNFDENAVNELVGQIQRESGDGIATESRDALIRFMKILGLCTEITPSSVRSVSMESFANAAFATYLKRFQEMHSIRSKGPLVADDVLIARVVEERLLEFSHLDSQRETIIQKLHANISDYNQRQPLLKVYEVAKGMEISPEPFSSQHFTHSLDRTYEKFAATFPGQSPPSRTFILAAVTELRSNLAHREKVSDENILEALQEAQRKIELFRKSSEKIREQDILFLREWADSALNDLQALDRLASFIPVHVSRERYESGLDPSPTLANEIVRIYKRHVTTQVLDANPLPFHQIVANELRDRFDSYPQIMADVLRGIRIIYHSHIVHMNELYQDMTNALELALIDAREHKNQNRFLADFRTHRIALDPKLESVDLFAEQAHDLEVFIESSSGSRPKSLTEHYRKALQEVEELESDIRKKIPPVLAAEVLKGNLSRETGDKYPELYLVSHEDILRDVEGNDARRNLANPEGRTLLHLIILLERYRPQLSEAQKEKVDEILLDIETSGDTIEETTQRALSDYQAIQKELVSKIGITNYIGTLPEMRKEGKAVSEQEVYRGIHQQITRRNLPKSIQEKFNEELHKTLERSPTLDANYFIWLTKFYMEHRSRILETNEIKIPDEEGQQGIPEIMIHHAKTHLQRDFPELQLIDLTAYHREVTDLNPEIAHALSHNARSYELLHIHGLIHRYFGNIPTSSPLHKIAADFSAQYKRLQVLETAGASLPHILRETHSKILEIYRKNHSEILVYLGEQIGGREIIALLPEIKDLKFDVQAGWKEVKDFTPVFIEDQGPFRKVVWRLQRGLSRTQSQKELDAILWDFAAIEPAADSNDVLRSTADMEKAVYLFYLKNRSHISPTPHFSAKPIQDSRKYDKYWELNAYDLEEISDHQKRTKSTLQTAYENRADFFIQFDSGEGFQERFFRSNERDQVMAEVGEENIRYEASFTANHRMYLMLHPLLSPKLKLLYNRAEVAKKGDHPEAAFKIRQEIHRAAILLSRGVDPAWVLDRFQQKVLDIYDLHREDILSSISFQVLAANFEEVREVPEYEVNRLAKFFSGEKPASVLLNRENELFLRLYAIVCQGGHDAKAVQEMMRGEEEGSDKSIPIEQVNENAARYYLKNMRVILSRLRPWPQTVPADEMERIRKHPLIAEESRQNILAQIKQRPPIDVNDPENDLLLRIMASIENSATPMSIQRSFRATWQAVRPQNSGPALMHAMANFFLTNEDQIMQGHAQKRP